MNNLPYKDWHIQRRECLVVLPSSSQSLFPVHFVFIDLLTYPRSFDLRKTSFVTLDRKHDSTVMRNSGILLVALASIASATLDPATSNTRNKAPAANACQPAKVSEEIQAAECSHNTRVSGKQTYAVWNPTKTTHPQGTTIGYGTCEAYTCTAPTDAQLVRLQLFFLSCLLCFSRE